MKLPFTLPYRSLLFLFVLILFLNNYSKAQQPISLTINTGKDLLVPFKQNGTTSIELSANVTGGSTINFLWTQLAGDSVSLLSPRSSAITVTGLTVGDYIFKCQVADSLNLKSDSILVKVVDYQKANRVPCRKGNPKTWVLSATSTKDLVRPYLRHDGFDIQGGDTIRINRNPNNGGVYNHFYLGDFGGDEGCPVIVIPNNEIVEIGGTNQRWLIGTNVNTSDSNFVNHVVIDGTFLRDKGIQYGFQSTGNSFGMSAKLVTDLEIKGCLFKNNSLGIQLKIFSDSLRPWTLYDNFVMKNVKIHDNYFQNIAGSEGLYIGNTDPSGTTQSGNDGAVPRLDSLYIYNNFFNGTAWDPIQTSAARYVEIHDNIILNGSTTNQSSQNWGILLGANCTGKIFNNVMYNGKGGTVGTLGYGKVEVYYNYIDSIMPGTGTSDAIYADMKSGNIIEATIPGMFPPLQVNIHNNIVSRFERLAIYHANYERTAIPGSIQYNYVIHPTKSLSQTIRSNANDVIANNYVVKSFPVTITDIGDPMNGPLVQVTQGSAINNFSNAKDIIDWLYGRLTGAPPSNQPPLANAGSGQTISLPSNSVSLNGSSSYDPDGTITAYQWTKIAGPAQFAILSSNQPQTAINNLVQGVYSFELKVTDNAGAVAKDTVLITVLDSFVIMRPNLDYFNIYPNPASNSINVKLSSTKNDKSCRINIISITGEIVYQSQQLPFSQNEIMHSVNIAGFFQGPYILQIVFESRTEIEQKFIKQ